MDGPGDRLNSNAAREKDSNMSIDGINKSLMLKKKPPLGGFIIYAG
ncbi:hypothetical protein GPLA_0857 [Paraglaciecola polaris LMG 21857]|uniref:Uncharacterized protein n=1 Tax=Paraglaciecola polaris LMG 21857 TaxID=1129793 RepID=K6ZSG7_9ALTE|nr:hypothetical protein GPLA_0857 [Paraglaciecola polaris LMG 21857]